MMAAIIGLVINKTINLNLKSRSHSYFSLHWRCFSSGAFPLSKKQNLGFTYFYLEHAHNLRSLFWG